MSKSVESITKTSRLLVVFHLFRHCQEVSFQEITDILLLQLKIGKHRTAEKIGYKLGLMLQFPHE